MSTQNPMSTQEPMGTQGPGTQTPYPAESPYATQSPYVAQAPYAPQSPYVAHAPYPAQSPYPGTTANSEVPQRGPRTPRRGLLRMTAVGLAAGAVGSIVTLGGTQFLAPAASAPVVATSPAPTSGSAPTTGWAAVASKVAPSVVSIAVTTTQGESAGSGVIWDTAGHVVTNAHVVAQAGRGSTITVALADGHLYQSEVVGADTTTDLAVLQLRNAPADLTPVDHSAVQVGVGDAVMAIGNPLGLSGTVTTGIVSAVNRPVTTSASTLGGSQPVVTNAIQTSAAVNPGNSGGALVNDAGTLIGINSSIASLSSGSASGQSGNIGIGFAIPTAEVDLIVPQLLSSGTAHHAFLGVSSQDAVATAGGFSTTGAGVAQVVADGPGASVLQPGDVITAIDGAQVTGTESLIGHVRALPVGQRVMVAFVRNGQAQSGQVTLGQSPND